MSRILLAAMILAGCSAHAWAQQGDAAGDETAAAVAAEAGQTETQADANADAADEAPPREVSPAAAAAQAAFEDLVAQWHNKVAQLRVLQGDRDKAQGESRAALDRQMAGLRAEIAELLDTIVTQGLEVYRADADAFPEINATLLAIAQFYIVGDAQGDGGDQYEKALPLIKSMIDMGAAKKWPQLYTAGGMAAYSIGELDLAEQYLKSAQAAGLLDNVPPRSALDPPAVKLVQDAASYLEALPTHRRHWEEELRIRAKEAEADDLPRVKLQTSKGDVVIELFENQAPQSVASFLTLVKSGFYDNVTFHRVLPLFMAQGGDPEGTGAGGPGYTIRDEQEAPGARRHFRGSLSMANKGKAYPNSGGSQFFLTFVPTSYLDGGHAVFGRVIEGMDVAASLKRRNPERPGAKPTADRILKATVIRDRGHEYKFEKLGE